MKALVLQSSAKMPLVDVELPKVGNDESLIAVEIAGIGGSEYLGFRTPGIRTLPNIMGHGFAGVSNGQRFVVDPVRGCGECKYCNDGYDNYVTTGT